MNRLLAIDPALNGTGWALFEAGLVECGCCTSKGKDLWKRCKYVADALVQVPRSAGVLEVIVEKPQAYVQRRSRGDPNDLIDMGILIGVALRALHPGKVRLVTPRTWKGTVPKTQDVNEYVIHRRTQKELSPRAYRLYMDRLMETKKALRHNVADAVGLGLWARAN